MKKIICLLLFTLGCTQSFADSSDIKIEQLEERLGDLELNSALKKFNFSGSFHNQFESMYQKRERTDLHDEVPAAIRSKLVGANSDKDSYILPMFMRVDLNFDARVSRGLMFYSTLGMSKFWNMAGRTGRDGTDNPNFESLRGSYAYEDSRAKFDTAYLNYSFKNSIWNVAIGRMTTNNGPPINQPDGVGRSGTYPFLAYNVIFDGIAIIHDFKKWMASGRSLKMRVFYTPFIQVDDNSRSEQVVDDSDAGGSDESVESHGSLVTLLTEFSTKNFDWVKKLEVFYSVYTFDKYYDSSRQFEEGNAPSEDYEPYYNDGIDYEGTTAHTVYLGFNGLGGGGLNLSFTANHFDIRSTGAGMDTSDNYLFTANYKFDNNVNSNHILGLEYLVNDENKIPTDSTSTYSNTFYNLVNGEGAHIYYTIPSGANQVFRFGAFSYHEGESEFLKKDIKTKTQVSYMSYKVYF